MSNQSFMLSGAGTLIREYPAGEPYSKRIRIFEIGEKLFVGVIYGEHDRQAQPRTWWAGRVPDAPPTAEMLATGDVMPPRLMPRKKAAPLPVKAEPESVDAVNLPDSTAGVAAPKLKARKKK